MGLTEKSCAEFAEKLASKEPVPGGGGVAALAGALGAALGTMVANYSIGKKAFLGMEDKHKEIIDKTTALREKMLGLVDEDAENFEPLSKAYGMPSSTDAEKEEKEKVLQAALKVAAKGPIEMVECIYDVIKLHEELVDLSTKLIISDVGCGVQMLKAAIYSASLNVTVNLNSIKDEVYVEETKEKVTRLVSEGGKICDEVFDKVVAVLG